MPASCTYCGSVRFSRPLRFPFYEQVFWADINASAQPTKAKYWEVVYCLRCDTAHREAHGFTPAEET